VKIQLQKKYSLHAFPKVLLMITVLHLSCISVKKKGNQNPEVFDLLRCNTGTAQWKSRISHVRTLL
jgi:hypothetical protein